MVIKLLDSGSPAIQRSRSRLKVNSFNRVLSHLRTVVLSLMLLSTNLAFLINCGATQSEASNCNNTNIQDSQDNPDLLRARGALVVNSDGEPVNLRGVASDNEVWNNEAIDQPSYTLTENDFQLMREHGVTVFRQALSYRWFESDANPFVYRQESFAHLNQVLNWAEANNIYIFLDMHVTQGGNQCAGEGDSLWTDEQNQARLIALWVEISRHYSNRAIIAGYEFINEPHPPTDQAWRNLANRIAAEIRSTGDQHMFVVPNTLVLNDNDYSKAPFAPFLINDNNVLYTAHIYDPVAFTLQPSHYWITWLMSGAHYPDTVSTSSTYVGGYYSNPGSSGEEADTGWRRLEGNWVRAEELGPGANLGQVSIFARNERGLFRVDDVVVEERDSNGSTQNILLENPGFEDPRLRDTTLQHGAPQNWVDAFPAERRWPLFWNMPDTEHAALDCDNGHDSRCSVRLGGALETRIDTQILNNYFLIRPGHQYRLSAWVRGENIGPFDANQGSNWDFLAINAYHAQFTIWDREYIENRVHFFSQWAQDNNVPFYIGEFGASAEAPNEEAYIWLQDMLTSLNNHNMHWTIFCWREIFYGHNLGVITVDPNDPTHSTYSVNNEMFDLLTSAIRE